MCVEGVDRVQAGGSILSVLGCPRYYERCRDLQPRDVIPLTYVSYDVNVQRDDVIRFGSAAILRLCADQTPRNNVFMSVVPRTCSDFGIMFASVLRCW